MTSTVYLFRFSIKYGSIDNDNALTIWSTTWIMFTVFTSDTHTPTEPCNLCVCQYSRWINDNLCVDEMDVMQCFKALEAGLGTRRALPMETSQLTLVCVGRFTSVLPLWKPTTGRFIRRSRRQCMPVTSASMCNHIHSYRGCMVLCDICTYDVINKACDILDCILLHWYT